MHHCKNHKCHHGAEYCTEEKYQDTAHLITSFPMPNGASPCCFMSQHWLAIPLLFTAIPFPSISVLSRCSTQPCSSATIQSCAMSYPFFAIPLLILALLCPCLALFGRASPYLCFSRLLSAVLSHFSAQLFLRRSAQRCSIPYHFFAQLFRCLTILCVC